MKKEKVENWVNYEVYEIVGGERHTLALCTEFKVAEIIAIALAKIDPKGDAYRVTSVNGPNDFVPGGGWYNEYYMESGVLKQCGLS